MKHRYARVLHMQKQGMKGHTYQVLLNRCNTKRTKEGCGVQTESANKTSTCISNTWEGQTSDWRTCLERRSPPDSLHM